ncbi:MAG: 16S rRNA (adenine(1518)-N(6)/adenine(1519)-N(6))-dimethyltransferase RsmA [bacterium]|nr:16S rRNA (adenine(1518)-N(6)/adenine(1519)-N(6))-dimethyltransferase RsmA [bacterium]
MPAYHAKKRLGQNFLKSENIIKQTIDLLEIESSDKIIEIGPGRGSLTIPLARTGASISGVEFDQDLQNYLKKLLGKFNNVEIIKQDFLEFEPPRGPIKVIGNIPYNITSPVIDWLVAHREQIDRVVLMVQKEVAERVASSAGVRAWSPIAIFTQLAFRVRVAFEVPPSAFSPAPSVTSAVLLFTPRQPVEIADRELFEKLIRVAFKQRRKTLVNNLVPDIIRDSDAAKALFAQIGLAANVRAEQVTIEQFEALANLLHS